LQFDPDVVDAFCLIVDRKAASDLGEVGFLRAQTFPATA
jgi:hypothetical protein